MQIVAAAFSSRVPNSDSVPQGPYAWLLGRDRGRAEVRVVAGAVTHQIRNVQASMPEKKKKEPRSPRSVWIAVVMILGGWVLEMRSSWEPRGEGDRLAWIETGCGFWFGIESVPS
ncbi:MAG: hypothetical protein ACI835_005075 [Planctomycetota bacterium]|jgi:hypothetical protein